ncbi:MAG: hypothetical protein LLF28_02675 [Nitrospiraceae bacterium]|nr:hypothetical protein [Nitrospiraceae bacterium]
MSKKAMRLTLLFLAVSLFLPVVSSAQVKCVNSEGESVIINNDIPSAKTEATARAKWSAIEQTVGVEIKAQSVVQNFALVDDAISKNIKGTVQSYKVLLEDNRKDTFWVKINACIEPTKAKDALMTMALNNSVAVYIPARKPRVISEHDTKKSSYIHTKDEYDETNFFSESLINKLLQQGYQVADIAPTHAIEAAAIDSALKSGNYMTLRSLMYKFLSNVLMIGKIDYTISTKKGEDVGYGINMPFYAVTTRLTYRLITRDQSGRNSIIHADTGEAKGLALSVGDATEKAIKELSEKITPTILDVLSKHVAGASKKISLSVKGVSDINTSFRVKEILQNTAWVTSVEEKSLGEFLVGYPENIVYLINSLSQKNFKISNFTGYSATMEYRQ